MDSLKLAQLMCSRLCHDLITPVGAISSGLEIIADSIDNIDPELLDLTSYSSKNAAQRLMYYRAAFGYSGLSLFKTPEKIKELLEDFLETYKIKLEWTYTLPEHKGEAFTNHDARILLNIVGIMIECAPYGGTFHITIKETEAQGLHLSFEITGELVGLKNENRLALTGILREDQVTPHSVQSYLTHIFLEDQKAHLTIKRASNEVLSIDVEKENAQDQHYGSLF